MADTILVTGGAGYVGSHVVVELARAGYAPVVLDNFSNSTPAVLPRLQALAGPPGAVRSTPMCATSSALRAVFHDHPIAAVVHCAGLKAVGESEERPLAYYDVNVGGAIALAEVMGEAGVATLVFSSSATVYGQPDDLPVTEDAPLRPQQRLRPHQARGRGFPARSRARQRQLAHRDPALLQSRRRAFVGHARRGGARPARTTSCRCCARSPPASLPTSRSTAATGPRPTAPAFATICTCRTWRRATSRRCAISPRRTAR